jgi:hypothetical protein
MGKDKHLCKWKKAERIEKLSNYRSIVEKPGFLCGDCGRVAAKKKHLCKPLRLKGD